MESNESLLNNDLQIDATAHEYLSGTAKWAKFIAIAGFIFSLMILMVTVYYAYIFSNITGSYGRSYRMGPGSFVLLFYGLIAIVWFLVSFFQFRFASKLQLALQVNDQVEFNDALRNFRIYYRISGIVTILSLILAVMAIFGIYTSTRGVGF